MTLVPAYGRDYRTAAEVMFAWNGGCDFLIQTYGYRWDGCYANVEQLKDFPGEHCKIRYNKLTDFLLVRIADGTITTDEEDEPCQSV